MLSTASIRAIHATGNAGKWRWQRRPKRQTRPGTIGSWCVASYSRVPQPAGASGCADAETMHAAPDFLPFRPGMPGMLLGPRPSARLCSHPISLPRVYCPAASLLLLSRPAASCRPPPVIPWYCAPRRLRRRCRLLCLQAVLRSGLIACPCPHARRPSCHVPTDLIPPPDDTR